MKTLLVAIVGTDNFGDEAMFKAIYRKLLSRGEEIVVATYNVDEAKRRFPNVNFIKIPILSKHQYLLGLMGKNVLSIDISRFDSLYISGGGNLNSLYPLHVFNIYLMVREFRKKRKYVEFRPQSVGPFFGRTKPILEFLIKRIVKFSDKFYVREQASYEYLAKKNLKIELHRDDAWEIPADSSISLPDGKYVGLCIRPWKRQEDLLREYMKELVKEIEKLNYIPLFIPIAYGGSESYIDNAFLKGIVPGIFLDDLIEMDSLTPETIKGIIGRCCFTIGMSYHFNVFSLSQGVPSAAIYLDEYYKIKNLGLYKAFGNPKLVFKIPETPPSELLRTILETSNI